MDRIVLRTHFIKFDLGIIRQHPHPLYHFEQRLKQLLNLLEFHRTTSHLRHQKSVPSIDGGGIMSIDHVRQVFQVLTKCLHVELC